jgi:hypothetical protein
VSTTNSNRGVTMQLETFDNAAQALDFYNSGTAQSTTSAVPVAHLGDAAQHITIQGASLLAVLQGRSVLVFGVSGGNRTAQEKAAAAVLAKL